MQGSFCGRRATPCLWQLLTARPLAAPACWLFQRRHACALLPQPCPGPLLQAVAPMGVPQAQQQLPEPHPGCCPCRPSPPLPAAPSQNAGRLAAARASASPLQAPRQRWVGPWAAMVATAHEPTAAIPWLLVDSRVALQAACGGCNGCPAIYQLAAHHNALRNSPMDCAASSGPCVRRARPPCHMCISLCLPAGHRGGRGRGHDQSDRDCERHQ